MALNFKNWLDFHHQIYRIYHGIIALSLVPFFLVFLELEVASIKEPRIQESLIWVVLFLFIPACFYLSWEVWKGERFRMDVDKSWDLKDKLVKFRSVEIKRFIWLEVACILSLLGLWLTAHYLLVVAYFAVLAQFSFLRPSEDRIIRTLQLTKEDRNNLHKPNFGQ